MKVLIVYASKEGQTEKIARRIAGVAGETAEVTVCEARAVPADVLETCDAVIVAAPVHFENYPRRIIRFVRENLALLQSKRTAFISVSGASSTPAGRNQAEDYVTDFQDHTRWTPDQCELVAGAVRFTKYNWLIRFVMRRISKSQGLDTDTSRDYEYTNWDEVERFARSFVASVKTAKVA